MTGPILVINPNSNPAVTAGLDAPLARFRVAGGPEIEAVTLEEGPFGIESQVDSDSVVLPLVHLVQRRSDASAIVIACYSDPGLDACRSATASPVLGIQESGVLTALSLGDRFGVIALSKASIDRHRRYLRRMGILDRLAAERAVDLSVHDTAAGSDAFERLRDAGLALYREDGADAIVLGCAGMAAHRARLERDIGCPVIDPTQAAVAMALGRVLGR
ncbi:MAG: aspartate/glutamate racemase family protein [Pseudomonadota bacterium]